jgi:hypothetical protein
MSNHEHPSTGQTVAAAGGLTSALTILIAWSSQTFFNYEMPANVAAAMAFVMVCIGGFFRRQTTTNSH